MKRTAVIVTLALAACGVTPPSEMRQAKPDGQDILPAPPRAAAECVQTQLAEQKNTAALARPTNTLLFSPTTVSIHGNTANESIWLIDFDPDGKGGSAIQWRVGSMVLSHKEASQEIKAAIGRCRPA